jgi:hypothetical protein
MQVSKYTAQGNMVWQAGNRRLVRSTKGSFYYLRKNLTAEWRQALVNGETKRKLMEKVEAALK